MKPAEELGIGLMVRFGEDPATSFARLRAFGLEQCQLAAPPDDYLYGSIGRRNTDNLRKAIEEYGISVTSLFISFPNQRWEDAHNTVGLVPPTTRAERIARACRCADWARKLGVEQIAAHVGWVPEDADDPIYPGFVAAMRGLCLFLAENEQVLAYETGQESIAVLARMIRDIGVDNQRINFDPANLLMYDRDDPMALVNTMGNLIVHVHCKDGCRPTTPGTLGCETPLGEGETNFLDLLKTMYRQGYRGPLTIEREIPAGPALDTDITHAVQLLTSLRTEMKSELKGVA
ncbi:MAG TPA: sugar phosphate isomerase/epimerase family protein [Armatimonadota bacterium]|nr:sugar phosphate isomerase/epimerase family protein [Armatimonadota bacterium]